MAPIRHRAPELIGCLEKQVSMRMPVSLRWALLIPPPPFPFGLTLQGGHGKGFCGVRLPYPAPMGANAAPLLRKDDAAE
jgi:hypothetical protein